MKNTEAQTGKMGTTWCPPIILLRSAAIASDIGVIRLRLERRNATMIQHKSMIVGPIGQSAPVAGE